MHGNLPSSGKIGKCSSITSYCFYDKGNCLRATGSVELCFHEWASLMRRPHPFSRIPFHRCAAHFHTKSHPARRDTARWNVKGPLHTLSVRGHNFDQVPGVSVLSKATVKDRAILTRILVLYPTQKCGKLEFRNSNPALSLRPLVGQFLEPSGGIF